MRGGQILDLQRFSTPGHDTVRTAGVAQPQRNIKEALPCTLRVERQRNRAIDGERSVTLSPRQADVLERLTQPGVIPSRDIIQAIWGASYAHPDNLKVHISGLRRKLAPLGYRIDSYIKRGYELVREDA